MKLESGSIYKLVTEDRIFTTTFEFVEVSHGDIQLHFHNYGIATIVYQSDLDDERIKIRPENWQPKSTSDR